MRITSSVFGVLPIVIVSAFSTGLSPSATNTIKRNLEQELRKIATIPDPELVVKFVPMATEGFFLRQASFILDGNELDSWYLEQLQTASEPQIIFQEKVGSGHRELVVRLVYSSESSLLSYMNDYQFALTQRIHVEARNGLRSHIYIQSKVNRFQSWSKRLSIQVRRDYEMTAKLADGDIPPPPQRAIESAENVLASLGKPAQQLGPDLKSEIEQRPELRLEELLNSESESGLELDEPANDPKSSSELGSASESNQLLSSKPGREITPAKLKFHSRRNQETSRKHQNSVKPAVQKESPSQVVTLSADEPGPKPREKIVPHQPSPVANDTAKPVLTPSIISKKEAPPAHTETRSHTLSHAPARPTATATTRQIVLPETSLSNASLPASKQSVEKTLSSRSQLWLLVLGAAAASFLVFSLRLVARRKSASGNRKLP